MTGIDVSIGDDVTMRSGAGSPLGHIDQYELVRELGGGGFGCVYLAKDTVAGIEVAVKGLPPDVRHNKEELGNIRANFALVSRLHHPNIAAALVLHPAKDVAYANRETKEKLRVFERDTLLVMEYAPGVTLSQWRRQFSDLKVPLAEALELTRQIADALDFSHAQKIIHRDIKPSNVMVETNPDGSLVARILDFGLAAAIRSSMNRVSKEVNGKSGTRQYMAPEQWSGKKQGAATDQYSLAVLFYELVTGEIPFASAFECDDPIVMMTAVMTQEPEIPTDLPKKVQHALKRGLSKERDQRFNTCADFVAALEGKRVAKPGGTRSVASALMGLAAALALAAVGVWWWQDRGGTGTGGTSGTVGTPPPALSTNAVSSVQEVPRVSGVPVAPPPSPVKVDLRPLVDAVRVEASVKIAACRRISDEDGFRKLKGECEDALARAVAEYEVEHWAASASAYTDVVERCESAIRLDEAREQAVSSRQKSEAARMVAKAANAEGLSAARFAAAEEIYLRGATECSNQRFAEAKGSFENARIEFTKSVQEAEAERDRLAKAECERKEREAAADRVRKRKQEEERLANLREEGREFTLNPKGCPGFEMKMKWCQQGNFTMGSPASEEGRYGGEKQHRVTLRKGFWLGETEVTQGQWRRLMGGETVLDLARKGLQDDTLYKLGGKQQTLRDFWGLSRDADPDRRCGDCDDKVPVYNVNWHEAKEFCRRLTAQERSAGRLPSGYEYRLPTEAEWEYACRAGTTAALPNGRDIRILGEYNAPALDSIAWYGGNSSVGFTGRGWNTSGWKEKQYPGGNACAREVRGKKPNDWGLYDMIGNVSEWCEDWYGDYGPSSYVSDPTGHSSGAGRVGRGGSWRSHARYCRSADRDSISPGIRYYNLGFRVALAPSLP